MVYKPDPEENYEIVDMENWSGQKNIVFSHQSLVMKALNRIIELCGHELADGVNETVTDPKSRATKTIYKEDTKKAFINAVKVAEALMIRNFDDTATEKIGNIEGEIETKKAALLGHQKKWWEGLTLAERKNYPQQVDINFLHKDLIYYKDFIEFEIDSYLQIFMELNCLIKREHDFQVEDFEA